MSECARGDLRDLLPDLLHGTLAQDAATDVRVHLSTCAVCAGELELLRAARAALDVQTPPVDVARVASAIAPYRRRSAVALDWRLAAAVTLLAVSGLAYALRQSTRGVSEPTTAATAVRGASSDSGIRSAPRVARPESPTFARSPEPVTGKDTVRRPRATRGASTTVASTAPDSAAQAGRIAFTSSVSDLDDADVEELLRQVDDLNAIPDANPSQLVDIGATEER